MSHVTHMNESGQISTGMSMSRVTGMWMSRVTGMWMSRVNTSRWVMAHIRMQHVTVIQECTCVQQVYSVLNGGVLSHTFYEWVPPHTSLGLQCVRCLWKDSFIRYVLQCVAVSCSVLQCVTVCTMCVEGLIHKMCVAVCCSVLQCVAVCCIVYSVCRRTDS